LGCRSSSQTHPGYPQHIDGGSASARKSRILLGPSGPFDGLAHEPQRHGVQPVFPGRSGGPGGLIDPPQAVGSGRLWDRCTRAGSTRVSDPPDGYHAVGINVLPLLAGPTTTAATTAWRRSTVQVSHAVRSAASVEGTSSRMPDRGRSDRARWVASIRASIACRAARNSAREMSRSAQ